jgi:2-polyprenyl-6-methoxyphenol hydroxylase-like FAD-dependent oxidoreductase
MAGTSSPSRAVIIGGGLGGLTAALALRRIGMEVVVFERAPSLDAIQLGAGLHLWSNALLALQHVGVAEAVAAVGTEMSAQRYLSWRGRPLGALDVAALSAELGAPTVGLSRPAIHKVLVDALDGENLRLGAELTGFELGRRNVTARFADGSEEQGDVLVGADGINSVVRRQLHGFAPPRYGGYTAWRALCDFDHPRVPVGEMWIYWGLGARILHYHVSGQRLYWLAMAKAPEGEPDPPAGRKAGVLARYRGWPSPVEAMIEATDEAAIIWSDVVDRDPVRHWGAGRVTLLGDAAHPMSPNLAQGAGQAIEDAVALAHALRDAADPADGLRAYEQRRVKRANDFVKTSRMVGTMSLTDSPVACAVRNQVVLRTVYAVNGAVKARKDLVPAL